ERRASRRARRATATAAARRPPRAARAATRSTAIPDSAVACRAARGGTNAVACDQVAGRWRPLRRHETHRENRVARTKPRRRIAMAVEAEAHLQRRGLPDERHAVDASV